MTTHPTPLAPEPMGSPARPPDAGVRPAPVVEPQFTEHLRVLWRVKWGALLLALLAAAAVFALRSGGADEFEADARVRLVFRDDAGLVIDADQADLAARTYAELGNGPTLLGAAVTTAGLDLTTEQAQDQVAVTASSTPGFVDIAAVASTPEDAIALAEAVAEALVAAVLEDQSFDQGIIGIDAVVETDADRTAARIPSSVLAETVMAFIVVLVLAAEALALVRSARGALRLGDPAGEVEELVGLPALALRATDRQASLLALAPFVLRHLAGRPVVTVVQRGRPVSSAGALLIAEAFGAVGRRSVFVDADVSSPLLGARPGLAEVVAGTVGVADVGLRTESGHAVVLNAGNAAGLDAVAVPDLEARIAGFGADVAVVSTTAAVPRLESLLVVARLSGAVVLVLDPDRSTRRQVVEAVDELRAVGQGLGAVVLVRAPRRGRTGRRSSSFVPIGGIARAGTAGAGPAAPGRPAR
jgi:capsular polysaccharide biosynthesis protein